MTRAADPLPPSAREVRVAAPPPISPAGRPSTELDLLRISTPWAAALTAAAVALPLLPSLATSAGASTPSAPSPTAAAASARPAPSLAQAEAGHRVVVRKSGLTSATTVPAPTRAALTKAQSGLTSTREGVRASAVLSQWTVQFSGGSAEQRAAFQRAVDTWASLVDSPVTLPP